MCCVKGYLWDQHNLASAAVLAFVDTWVIHQLWSILATNALENLAKMGNVLIYFSSLSSPSPDSNWLNNVKKYIPFDTDKFSFTWHAFYFNKTEMCPNPWKYLLSGLEKNIFFNCLDKKKNPNHVRLNSKMITENITAQHSKLQNIFWDFYDVLFFTTLLKNIIFFINFFFFKQKTNDRKLHRACDTCWNLEAFS